MADDPESSGDRDEAGRALGERVAAREFALTVESVKECPRPGLEASHTILGVELVVEGLAERDVYVNPFYAQIIDGSGASFRPTLQGCLPKLASVRLGAGERTRGFVNFELPRAAHRLRLDYEPANDGGGRQVVSVVLDR